MHSWLAIFFDLLSDGTRGFSGLFAVRLQTNNHNKITQKIMKEHSWDERQRSSHPHLNLQYHSSQPTRDLC